MNKKELPHIITVVSFIVFIVLGLACATTSYRWEDMRLNGEEEKILTETIWNMTISDLQPDQPIKVTFLPDGRVNGFIGNSTWERKGTDICLVIEGGSSFIEGKFNTENNTIIGTISRSRGTKANIRMVLVGGATDTTLNNAFAEENRKQEAQITIRQEKASYFTGDGGKRISLGIGIPKSQGLNTDQAYLSTLVQGVLVDNISKYSEIAVLDRVSLDRVIAETLDPTFEDNLDIVRLGHVAQVGNWLTGNIIRTSSGFTLQLNITDTTPNAITVASYTGTCTIAEFDNHTAIHKATLTLLEGMGVVLTDKGKTELAQASGQQYVQAQTALSQGILAQQQGNEVVALVYLNQAAALEPSLAKEAASRSALISANIKSGNIGTDARNDVAWRRRWVERLTETEELFNRIFSNRGLPYTLFYSTGIQQGRINYQTETIELSFPVNIRVNSDWLATLDSTVQSVQVVYDGLRSTGRAATWGLEVRDSNNVILVEHTYKPWVSQTNNDPFNKNWQTDFTIVFELLNDGNKVIGRQSVTLSPTFGIYRKESTHQIAKSYIENTVETISFNTVNVNDTSDKMIIRIVSINGDTFANAKIQVNPITEAEWAATGWRKRQEQQFYFR